MDEEMDHGPILTISNLKSLPCRQAGQISNLYSKELEEKLAELGGELLIKTIPKWMNNKIKPREQDHSKATFTKKITKEDGLINFNEPAEIIERKIRAFTPWPGAYFFIKNKRIIITEAELKDGKLAIKRIKPEGKKEMPFKDFLRGNAIIKNFITPQMAQKQNQEKIVPQTNQRPF
jgi:methionyl-tRNA formyltransferase